MIINLFPPLFFRLRVKHGSSENVNNPKGDFDRRTDSYDKPVNHYVAQLRENVVHNSVS